MTVVGSTIAAKGLRGSEPQSPSAPAPLLPTYARLGVTFVEGEGCTLTDSEGEQYLDLVAGIAVVALGHRHPAPLAAAHAQLDRLWHVSNLYSTTPMEELASGLSKRFGGASAFFCNSGAEAVEAALKWARKATGKTGLVALELQKNAAAPPKRSESAAASSSMGVVE